MSENMEGPTGKKKITGFHVTHMFVAFFGVVAAVNFLMAWFAVSSFGGTVVDNSYVASQKYNQWLEEGRKQAAHGWSVAKPVRIKDQIVLSVHNDAKRPLKDAIITALAHHPVGRTESFHLSFSEIAPGRYHSNQDVPLGRWKLKISVTHGHQNYDLLDEIR